MHPSMNLDDLLQLIDFSHNTTKREDLNEFLRTGTNLRMLDSLGIHIGIFGFIDYESAPVSLLYLTDDSVRSASNSLTHRTVRWPFRVCRDGQWQDEERRRAGF